MSRELRPDRPEAGELAGIEPGAWWDDSEYALREYAGSEPGDALIQSAQEEPGYRLPPAYIAMMRCHNGGNPRRRCPGPSSGGAAADDPDIRVGNHIASGHG